MIRTSPVSAARRAGPARGARRAAFTLVEVVIAATIMTLTVSVAVGVFSYALRIAKAQRTNLLMAEDSLNLQRILKEKVTSAQKFVIDQGRTLHIIQPDGGESVLQYIDADDNPETLVNNRLVWDPDSTTEGDETTLIRNISPMDDFPVFDQPPGNAALRVRLRLGDRSVNSASEDAVSGYGYQTFVVDSSFTPRNSVQ